MRTGRAARLAALRALEDLDRIADHLTSSDRSDSRSFDQYGQTRAENGRVRRARAEFLVPGSTFRVHGFGVRNSGADRQCGASRGSACAGTPRGPSSGS